jgi:hypothetical protein
MLLRWCFSRTADPCIVPQQGTHAQLQKFRNVRQLPLRPMVPQVRVRFLDANLGMQSPKSDRINLFDVADNLFLLAPANAATVT